MSSKRKIIEAVFFRLASGNEPVRDWLKGFPREQRRLIGEDIKTVELGWPIGMPMVRKIEPGLWEVRTILDHRIARVFFTVKGRYMVLLHSIIKKSQATPKDALSLAKRRKNSL